MKSRSVVSDSLWPHGLHSPWNSPGQNSRVGSLSLLKGIFPTQGSNPGLLHCRWILYQLSHKESPPTFFFSTPWTRACQAPLSMEFSRQEYCSGLPCLSPGDLPDSGIEPGSPALQADSLLFESPRKPPFLLRYILCHFPHPKHTHKSWTPLSDMVANSHMWLYKLRLRIHFLICRSHLSVVRYSHALIIIDVDHTHHPGEFHQSALIHTSAHHQNNNTISS